MACKDGFFCGEYLPFGPKKNYKISNGFFGFRGEKGPKSSHFKEKGGTCHI
jgi:hypothetical protein